MRENSKMLVIIYTILAIAAVLALGVGMFLAQPEFGKAATGERLERIRKSPNFHDERFVNEVETKLMTDGSPIGNLMEFIFKKSPDSLRAKEGDIPVVRSDLKSLPAEGDLYVWFGHSSFLLRLGGRTILADPVFYKASPVSFVNRAFPGTDIYHTEDMPDSIDYLLISHDHWDHLDHQAVSELQPRVGKAVCPLGVGEDLEYWGYTKDQIIELDWNESSGWFHCLPTRHFSGRSLFNGKTMPASWLIESPTRTVFYSGDGGYSDRFKRFGRQFKDIDLAIMENGQYNKKWSQIHTLPEQLGKEVSELGARRFVTVHHSKFCLARHSWEEPRRNERQAAEQYGLSLITCSIGQIVELGDSARDMAQ